MVFSRRFVPFVVSLTLGIALAVTARPAAAQCELHETQKLLAPNAEASDGFGYPVSISGNTLVVGARYRDCASGADCGSAYVYRFNGTNWVEDAELIPSDLASFDHFGGGVAVDGNLIVVGAVHYEANYVNLASAAYVFRYVGTGWIQEAKLIPPDAAQLDLFSPSIAVRGDRVFLGAYYGDFPVVGALYIFRRQGTTWMQEAKLQAPGLCDDGSFGDAIFAHGDRVLVGGSGSFCKSNVASPPGAAFVFRREGTNWLQEAQLPWPPGGAQGLGITVSLSADVALVGHVVGDHEPAVSVYRRSGILWSYEALLGPFVGTSAFLSVATDGEAAVVWTHVFIHNGNNWPEVAQLKPTDAPGGSSVVSISGDNVLLGAYVFDLPHDCNANGVGDACDIASGTSQDVDGNGYPDGCCVPNECCESVESPEAQPGAIAKNRYITLIPGNPRRSTALRVTLSSLHHPDPPTLPSPPPADFSSWQGQVRWVGPPSDFPESSSDGTTFKAARLQCSPHYMDWSAVGSLHVYGSEILPSSAYDVQAVGIACLPAVEADYSLPPLSVSTSRWADVTPPYQQTCAVSGCTPCTNENCVTQPNALDIATIVNALKEIPGAPSKVEVQLQPNAANPLANLSALDIVVAVDAVRGFSYPYPGPTACPP